MKAPIVVSWIGLGLIAFGCRGGVPRAPGGSQDAVAAAGMELGADPASVLEQVDTLVEQGRQGVALAYLERAAGAIGDHEKLLERYNDLAVSAQRYELALETAQRLERAASRSSPWNQLKIAEALLHLGRSDEAMPYIERAVDERSFKRYQVFELSVYDPLRDEPRFRRCVEKARENIGIGAVMPNLAVTTLDGRSMPLSALAGRVVLVDFWATWCAPCIQELPNLLELYAEHSEEGFAIVGLSLDEDRDDVQRYVAEKTIPWPIGHLEDGWHSEIVEAYGVNALPSLWLYDREGVLRHYNLRGGDLRAAIEALL